MKKKLLLMAACLGAMFAFTACGSKDDGNTLTVLNYGKYIESSVLDAFEEETGIHVNYEEYVNPEDSVRDTFVPALKRLGFSSNSTDKKELETALDQLIEQKPLVYSYLVDESADEVVAGNASMALVYSGEAAYAESLSKDLDYSVPTEGSNMWIDSWMIAKTCKNQENAEKFLDFLCREDIAMKNFEYVYYATPNKAVYDKLDKETQENKTIFPDEETLNNCEIFRYLDEDSIALYNKLWKELKSK